MFVTGELPSTEHAGLDVSAKAIFLRGEKYFLFLQKAQGEFERCEVKVGPEHEGKILVTEGIEPGQKVVSNGCLLLDQIIQANGGS